VDIVGCRDMIYFVNRIGCRDEICFVDRVGCRDRICFVDRVGFVGWKRMDTIKLWQNLPSYWAHMHLSLSQRPQTAMHVHQIT
jgi:hypothetical protein